MPSMEYVGAKHETDPLRFYYWPVLGRLYRRRVELCLGLLSGGGRVLEVGFGSGLTFLNLHDGYQEIHGLDLTADVNAVAAVFRARGIETKLLNGSVLEMPFEDDSFDSVILISILEHLQPGEQQAAFREIGRVLKAGGEAVYGVPVDRPLMTAVFRLMGYDIRGHHFSTERDVASAAQEYFGSLELRTMRGICGLSGPIYEAGRVVKE